LWKSSGEPEKEIRVAIGIGNEIPNQVYENNKPIIISITENNETICPDFDGFGNIHVLGIPTRNCDDQKIGVLMIYRDRNNNNFEDKDINSASILTSIAATTLQVCY
jgi:hypothetical protein